MVAKHKRNMACYHLKKSGKLHEAELLTTMTNIVENAWPRLVEKRYEIYEEQLKYLADSVVADINAALNRYATRPR